MSPSSSSRNTTPINSSSNISSAESSLFHGAPASIYDFQNAVADNVDFCGVTNIHHDFPYSIVNVDHYLIPTGAYIFILNLMRAGFVHHVHMGRRYRNTGTASHMVAFLVWIMAKLAINMAIMPRCVHTCHQQNITTSLNIASAGNRFRL